MRLTIALTVLATSAGAQTSTPDLVCAGTTPQWTLETTAQGASFAFGGTSEFTLQLTTFAQGADWPRAFTYTGRGDSAIVIVEQAQPDGRHPVRILTQRGETPILLLGTCDAG